MLNIPGGDGPQAATLPPASHPPPTAIARSITLTPSRSWNQRPPPHAAQLSCHSDVEVIEQLYSFPGSLDSVDVGTAPELHLLKALSLYIVCRQVLAVKAAALFFWRKKNECMHVE